MIKYYLQCLFVVLFVTKTTAQTTYTVQPDATTGIDAWVLSEYTPNNDTSTNYGTDARLDAWRWTNNSVPYSARAYLKFDVSSLPTSAVVCSAILTVHTDGNNEMSGSTQPNAFYLKRATSSWTQSGITWHTQPTLSTTNVISVGSFTSTTAGTSYTIDVTSHMQDMITNPSTNYGWAIMLQNETNTYAALGLASSNHATASYHPMLTVVYVPSLTVTATSTTLCAGGSATLTASGASTYSWTPSSSGLNVSTGSVVIATPTASTTYTVTGTTGSCSTAQKTIAITVNPLPTLTVSPSATPSICIGSNVTFTASGASTYTWTPNTSLTCSVCTSPVANPTATTNYTVTGTNSNGCINTKAVTLTVNSLPTLTVSPSASSSICKGSSITFTASGASTYTWTPNTSLTCSVCASPAANPTATTNYTVTGTNSNGCINTKAVTLTVNPVPSVTVNSLDTIYGSSTATLTATGATTYSWTPNTGLSATTGSTVIASPTVTTIYTVTGTGANTCTASVTSTVVDLNVYFRSAQTGYWNSNSTWQSSLDNSTWTAATSTPTYKSRAVTIQTGHKVSIAYPLEIDETTVNGALIYQSNYLTINDGTGTDLTVNGSFQHNSTDSVVWLGSSTWTLGANDTLEISGSTIGNGWQTHYAGGISSIPASANWILNKTGTMNPPLYSNTGMFYPNLIIQNNTGTLWTTTTPSSFTGSAAPPTIQGNLSIGGSGTGNVSFLDTNTYSNSVMVKGNLTINSGSTLRSHGTGLEVQGNFTLNGTIDYGTNGIFVLSGSNNQTITGSSLSFKNLSLNKTLAANTVTLNSPASVIGTFTFTSGVLVTDTVHLLTFNAGSAQTGVNDSSFVSGPVKKIGNTAFTFPLGKHTNAQTIGISAPSNTTDAFQAEYFDTDPTAIYGATTDTSFNYVSTCQFFNLLRKNGTSNIQPTLSYDLTSCVAYMIPAPRVIGINGTTWKDLGESNFLYSNFGGTISTATTVTHYGAITLGNNSLAPINYLDTTFQLSVAGACGAIYMSEYVQDTLQNCAIELYNPTADTVNLNHYYISTTKNSSTTAPPLQFKLVGKIAPYKTFVVVNSKASTTLKATANQLFENFIFNGNDAITLEYSTDIGIIIDKIGDYNIPYTDSGWVVSSYGDTGTTKNHTLTRLMTVAQGNPDWETARYEWYSHPIDTYSFLGWHNSVCSTSSIPTANMVIAPPLQTSIYTEIQNGYSPSDHYYNFNIKLTGSWSNPINVYYNDNNFYTNFNQSGTNPLSCKTPTANDPSTISGGGDWSYGGSNGSNFVVFPTGSTQTQSFQIDISVTTMASDIIQNGDVQPNPTYIWGCFAIDIDPTGIYPFPQYNIGTTYEADLYITTDDLSGIQTLFNNNQLKVYPNPFNNQVIIENRSQTPITKITVNDVLGREITNLTPNQLGTINIDTHAFNNGVYFIKIYNNDDCSSIKLIKE